ncbi:hypothetical protein Hanom_Chr04g00283631 [Helianthus anomalus]
MTDVSVSYVDYHVVFYIHSSMMVCLKFLLCFMAEIVVFYDFVHFVGKIDFVAEPHPIHMAIIIMICIINDQ